MVNLPDQSLDQMDHNRISELLTLLRKERLTEEEKRRALRTIEGH
jgi:hypothetical protein